MKNRSKALIVATVLATAYAIYLMTHFFGGVASNDGAAAVGAALATALVMPHMISFLVGAIFGWISVFTGKTWAALVGAILYAVGTALFLTYFMFGVPILVLGFVGYSNQKKINGSAQ